MVIVHLVSKPQAQSLEKVSSAVCLMMLVITLQSWAEAAFACKTGYISAAHKLLVQHLYAWTLPDWGCRQINKLAEKLSHARQGPCHVHCPCQEQDIVLTLKSSSKPSIWEAISVEVGRLLAAASWASLAGVGTRACSKDEAQHSLVQRQSI